MAKRTAKTKPKSDWSTIKIPSATYKRLRTLLDRVCQDGWSAIHATRTDTPSLSGLVEEAVGRIEAAA